jgi:hypothetical protein
MDTEIEILLPRFTFCLLREYLHSHEPLPPTLPYTSLRGGRLLGEHVKLKGSGWLDFVFVKTLDILKYNRFRPLSFLITRVICDKNTVRKSLHVYVHKST